VWKKEEAHSIGLITDIAFHPFVPWWLVSAGEDGVAKVWDLRCGARALATLDEHFAVVNRVAWSPTHSEILATGSFDRQFKLWSLNLPPHYVIANKRATAPVAGAVCLFFYFLAPLALLNGITPHARRSS
jgi:WD40 repeat protein